MTKHEARERMLAALAAAGVDGLMCRGDDRAALYALANEGLAVRSNSRWRLSDQELARRILRAVGFEHAAHETVLIDAVAGILRGL